MKSNSFAPDHTPYYLRGARMLKKLARWAVIARTIVRCYAVLLVGRNYLDYNGIKMLFSGDGDWQEILYHQYFSDWYEKEETFFSKILDAGDTVLDIGANMG